MKKYVIAGNQKQALDWIKQDTYKRHSAGITDASMSDYVVVANVDRLRGVTDPHGVFIGTWRERDDVLEIVEALFMACHLVNRDLQCVRDEIRAKRIKPTPKKFHAGYTIAEEELSGILAQEIQKSIDEEIVSMIKPAPSGYSVSYEQLVPTLIKAIEEIKNGSSTPT